MDRSRHLPAAVPNSPAVPDSIWKDCLELIKPGIVRSNVWVAWMGYAIAAGWSAMDVRVVLALGLGTAFLVAGGCVLNNAYERDADAYMKRTQNRALVVGRVNVAFAWRLGWSLAGLGLLWLGLTLNLRVAGLGLLGLLVYVGAYTVLLKRRSTANTWVGSISGAIPPVMGAMAVMPSTSSTLVTAALLFLLLFLWQPGHFFALALMHLEDYRRSPFRIVPVVKGVRSTVLHTRLWIASLVAASALPVWLTQTGWLYWIGASLLGIMYVGLSLRPAVDRISWARQLFFASLVYLLGILGVWLGDRAFF